MARAGVPALLVSMAMAAAAEAGFMAPAAATTASFDETMTLARWTGWQAQNAAAATAGTAFALSTRRGSAGQGAAWGAGTVTAGERAVVSARAVGPGGLEEEALPVPAT